MPINKCECINLLDRRNILFLMNMKIKEIDRTMKEIDKKLVAIDVKYLSGQKAQLKPMIDSLNGTRSRILDTPICETST